MHIQALSMVAQRHNWHDAKQEGSASKGQTGKTATCDSVKTNL